MKIGYIVHNLNDAAVERRCRMFEMGGADVMLAGFCREAALRPAIARRNPLMLGRSADAAFVRRAMATLRETVFHRRLAGFLSGAQVLVARNLEQLAIARSVAGGQPLVYECLDIHRSLVGTGPASRLVRGIEAMLLPHVSLLLTSSPAFLRNHFDHRPLHAPAVLVENKLLLDEGRAAPVPQPPAAARRPLRIGWFGMLRCQRTFAFLADLVRRSQGKVEVLVSGKPSPAELPTLERDIAAIPGMEFTGAYAYDDLPALYGRCHFAWTIDWFEEGLNSSWLLPNRLYEAMAFGSIPIALADVEVGRWLGRHDAGLLLHEPEDATARLLAMDEAEIDRLQRQVLAVDRAELLAGPEDGRKLVQRIRAAAGL